MKEITGNLLDIQEGIIVHGCNCQGVMGSGIARQIKDKWPTVYIGYKYEFDKTGLMLGDIQVFSSNLGIDNFNLPIWEYSKLPSKLIIVNAMTQKYYGSGLQVNYDAISACFYRIKILADTVDLPIYFPKIGAGLGGGDWSIISQRIDQALQEREGTVVILPEKP